ncbi:MAG: HAD family phosphatase [Dehalococcoidia bacterium]|nr:HAD family phosphatase [Dehalococcoidia bacterium]
MNEVRALICDMDGVLADTEPLFYLATCDALAPRVLTEDEYALFIGTRGLDEWLSATYDLPSDFLEVPVAPAYYEAITRGLPAFAGAVALLETAHARGLAVAVASTSSHTSIDLTLGAAGLRDYFPLVVSASDVAHGKPAPDIYLYTARLLGVPPESCIAIEDSLHGIVSASAAGMRVVQSRQAAFVTPPHPSAHAVIKTLEAFKRGWLDGEALG